MYARLEVRLGKPLQVDEARLLFEAPRFLKPNDPTALSGTLFGASQAAASAYVVYVADNGGYVIIALWNNGYALEVVVEPRTAKIRRAVDQAWPALAETLESQKPSLESAYLVEQGTDDDLERGLLAFRSYVGSAFTTQAVLTAGLTLVLAGLLAIQTSASVGSFLLAAASALSVFIVGVWLGVRKFRSKKLEWEKVR